MHQFISLLRALGYRVEIEKVHVTEYKGRSGVTLYVLNQPERFSIAFSPIYEREIREAAESVGAIVNQGFYHNSNLSAFPKRLNTGVNPITYGIKVEFDTVDQLRAVLEVLP